MREIKIGIYNTRTGKLKAPSDYDSNPQLITVTGLIYKDGVIQKHLIATEYIGQPDSKGQEIYSCHVLENEYKTLHKIEYFNDKLRYVVSRWHSEFKEWISDYNYYHTELKNMTIAGTIHDPQFKELLK